MSDRDLSRLDAMRDDPEYVEAATFLAQQAGEDPETYITALIERAKEESAARHAAAPPNPASSGPVSPAVKRLREMLG